MGQPSGSAKLGAKDMSLSRSQKTVTALKMDHQTYQIGHATSRNPKGSIFAKKVGHPPLQAIHSRISF
jgi:hypothetical protein